MQDIKEKIMFQTPILTPLGWAIVLAVALGVGLGLGAAISDDCLRLRGLL